MRKLISVILALCLAVVPTLALADSEPAPSSFCWVTDDIFELYDLGFSITLPEGWTHADEATINAMNGLDENGNLIGDSTESVTALNPTAIAMICNSDYSVSTTICCEEVEDPEAVTSIDQYMELLANDLVTYSGEDGVTFSYDPTTISDATLCTQTFREMAVTGSDGSIIDLLVCHSGMGTYYLFMIVGTEDSIGAFAVDFVTSISEIEAVG
ncbi:MAG: hypothetical protein ACI4L8_04100 [Candidatus Fimadaptatus sp.]